MNDEKIKQIVQTTLNEIAYRPLSVNSYVSSNEIMKYFGIDKNNFSRLVSKGMPVIVVGSRYKGKINEIESWFKARNSVPKAV